jgi:2-polyprenyl-3-methyl-5-hydroxy-6-metoxy-1,4-benzoquinol methylase
MQADYAAHYRELYERHWWWRARERIVLRELARLELRAGQETILDIGCGDGLFFDALSRYGDVQGVEADESLVSPGGPWRDRIHVGPFDERFRPGRRFSLILMLDVLEHLADPSAALAHVRSLLTDDGTLVLTVPAFKTLWTTHDDLNHHYTRYTKPRLRQVAEDAGLAVLRMRYLFQWTCPAKLAVRLKERFVSTTPASPRLPPPMINRALYTATLLEQAILQRLEPPFGSSLLMVAGRQTTAPPSVPRSVGEVYSLDASLEGASGPMALSHSQT